MNNKDKYILLIGDFMSIGYGAKCKIIDAAEDWIMYEYTSYNLNLEDSKKAMETLDGIIIINIVKEYLKKVV